MHIKKLPARISPFFMGIRMPCSFLDWIIFLYAFFAFNFKNMTVLLLFMTFFNCSFCLFVFAIRCTSRTWRVVYIKNIRYTFFCDFLENYSSFSANFGIDVTFLYLDFLWFRFFMPSFLSFGHCRPIFMDETFITVATIIFCAATFFCCIYFETFLET